MWIEGWIPAQWQEVPEGNAEEEAAFLAFCGKLSRRLAVVSAILLLICTLAWWPLDAWVLPAEHVGAFHDFRLHAATLEISVGLLMAFGRLEGRLALGLGVVSYVLFVAVVGLSMGAMGPSGIPWFADAQLRVIPSALLPIRFHRRLLATLLIAGALAASYFLPYPGNFGSPFAAGQFSFLGFTVFFTQMLGETSYRQIRRGFFEQRAIAAANAQLANMTDSLQEIVATRTQELRALALHLDEAQEAERKRIARDLHDNLGQELTALRYTVARLEDRLQRRPEDAAPLVEDLVVLVAAATQTVRGFVSTLRPKILEDLGLVAAAEWLGERCRRSSGLDCVVVVDESLSEVVLDPETSLVVFRVLQEATTNAMKHAKPSRIRLQLSIDGASVIAEVSDDGVGFDLQAPRAGFGLRGLEERVLASGGQLQLRSAPGGGTQVSLRLPIPGRRE